MAYIEHKECPICENVTQFVNGKCADCEHRKKLAALHKWNAMSYDDRLADLHKRLQEIERGPMRY